MSMLTRNDMSKLASKDIRRIERLAKETDKRQPLPRIEAGAEEYLTDGVNAKSGEHTVLQHYASKLHKKERHRFNKLSGEMRSMLRDVGMGHRRTIMDDLVKTSLTETSFRGAGASEIKVTEADGVGQIVLFNFSGFYVLFWMLIAFVAVKVTVEYYMSHNGDLSQSEILRFMTSDIFSVALIDLVMYMCTYFVLLVQFACKKNWISWKRAGWAFTSLYEIAFVVGFLYVAEAVMKFHWISKIFIFLHSLVLLMKMHSFAFFNGYMWSVLEELEFSKGALKKYKETGGEDDLITQTLEKSCQFCSFELKSQGNKSLSFPDNITWKGFFIYTMFPTLVYQLEYPRSQKIRWHYVFEKLCAIFGVIITMMIIAQSFMYPVAMRAIALRNSGLPIFWERIREWLYLLLDLVPSFIIMYLLVWYLIWDAILNCIAELTYFGDRHFYGDWWNCVSWDEFARHWNVPVHQFLLRHVYHSSISFLKLSKIQATLMTFFLSSIVHELAMYVLFKNLRFYLFFLQMGQLPLVQLSNSKFLRKKKILGNVIFWIGICTGPSLMCTLYLTF
ncbi:LAMI_0D07888g1_1 [Lachancea mirantina]|uniref:O-acyltransferase n=1 Tax=Lachancea mirantina TaxID=1230905 RepID=A0A1G4JCX9_9SACH|nr:LAMI_0D07888g1_1 [Lachancea mirantina]